MNLLSALLWCSSVTDIRFRHIESNTCTIQCSSIQSYSRIFVRLISSYLVFSLFTVTENSSQWQEIMRYKSQHVSYQIFTLIIKPFLCHSFGLLSHLSHLISVITFYLVIMTNHGYTYHNPIFYWQKWTFIMLWIHMHIYKCIVIICELLLCVWRMKKLQPSTLNFNAVNMPFRIVFVNICLTKNRTT